jgi:hypothetical protein
MSEQSPDIGALATALAIAQGKITGALKDSANPFFKSKYADLASVWDACRGPLSENGIAVIQTTDVDDQGVVIVTTLAHKSGQWVRGKLRMVPKDATPQGFGSAITYGRRYGLAAIVGVAQIDDDANAASGRNNSVTTHAEPTSTEFTNPQGEKWTAKDTKKANEFAVKIQEAQMKGNDLLELWDEVKTGGETFAMAVWRGLPKSIKDEIKDQDEQRRNAA